MKQLNGHFFARLPSSVKDPPWAAWEPLEATAGLGSKKVARAGRVVKPLARAVAAALPPLAEACAQSCEKSPCPFFGCLSVLIDKAELY